MLMFEFGFGFEIKYVLISAVALITYLIVGHCFLLKTKQTKSNETA